MDATGATGYGQANPITYPHPQLTQGTLISIKTASESRLTEPRYSVALPTRSTPCATANTADGYTCGRQSGVRSTTSTSTFWATEGIYSPHSSPRNHTQQARLNSTSASKWNYGNKSSTRGAGVLRNDGNALSCFPIIFLILGLPMPLWLVR